jgi:hypothetical protein
MPVRFTVKTGDFSNGESGIFRVTVVQDRMPKGHEHQNTWTRPVVRLTDFPQEPFRKL